MDKADKLHTFNNPREAYDMIFNDDTSKSSFKNAIHGMPSARIEALVSKTLFGRPLHVLVIGGSNTAGGGLEDYNTAYYRDFVLWWDKVIRPQTRSTMTFTRIAIGGTGSDFFTFCLQNFLSNVLPDLVLVELSVNDYGSNYGTAAEPLELLTRRLLGLPSLPVVFYIDVVDRALLNGEVRNTRCLNMENLGQRKLAQHYDITTFSWRELACPLTGEGRHRRLENSNLFHTDGSHVSSLAHAQITLMMTEYFKELLEKEPEEQPQQPLRTPLPEPLFSDPYVMDEEVSNSMCLSYLVPNWQKKIVQTLDANITKHKDFHYVSPSEEKKRANHLPFRTDAYGGWATTSKKGILKIGFDVPALVQPTTEGTAGNEELRSVSIIFRSKDNDATARAWVDDEEDAAVHIKTNFCGHHMYQTRVLPLETDVSPGYHELTVASYGEGGEFVVSGVIVSYRGYRGFLGYRPFDVKYKVWSKKDYKKARCKKQE